MIFLPLDATVLAFDPKTAHGCIVLSKGFTKATVSDQPVNDPNSPKHFNFCSQVLVSVAFSRGPHDWEVHRGKSNFVGIGLSYSSIDHKAPLSRLGRPAQICWIVTRAPLCSIMWRTRHIPSTPLCSPRASAEWCTLFFGFSPLAPRFLCSSCRQEQQMHTHDTGVTQGSLASNQKQQLEHSQWLPN